METKPGMIAEIILKEENRRFAMDKSKPVEGQIILEKDDGSDAVRIKLHINNLRPENSRRFTYKLMMLGLEKGRSLHKMFSGFSVDQKGNAAGQFEVKIDDADGKGNPLSSFYIFLIVAAGTLREPYHPVIKGDWDRKWHEDGETQVNSEKPVKKHRERPPAKIYNGYYTVYVKSMTEELIRQADRFIDTIPFEERWLAEKWYRVNCSDAFTAKSDEGILPVVSCGAMKQIEKYGHFIFAYNDEFCLIGVPGINDEFEHPENGASGFTRWNNIRESEKYGYWLMMINRKTGDIVGF